MAINFESKLPFRVHVGAIGESLESVKNHWFTRRKEIDNGGDKWKLYAPADRFLPFQIFIPIEVLNYNDLTASDFAVYQCDDVSGNFFIEADIPQLILKQVPGEGAYFICKAETTSFDSGFILPTCQYYYFVLTLQSGRVIVSEWFYVPPPEKFNELMKLEWWNSCDFANLIYQNGFKNKIWLDGTLAENEPAVEETGFENGYGEYFQTSSRYIDNYNFEELVPEFMMHALLATKMHDNIKVTLPKQIQSGEMRNAKIRVSPESSGLYTVGITFEQLTRMVKGSCCENKQFASLVPVLAVDDVIILDSRPSTNTVPFTASVLRNDTGFQKACIPGTIPTVAGGSVVLSANGTFVYTPPVPRFPVDAFVYTLIDGFGTTDTANCTMNFAVPLPVADTYNISFAGTGNFVVPGNPSIFANDVMPVDFFANISTPVWQSPSVDNFEVVNDLSFTGSTLTIDRRTGTFVLNVGSNPGVGNNISFEYALFLTNSTRTAYVTIDFIFI